MNNIMYTITFKVTSKSGKEMFFYIQQNFQNKQGYSLDGLQNYSLSYGDKETVKSIARNIWNSRGVDSRVTGVEGTYIKPSTVVELIEQLRLKTPEILQDMVDRSKVSSITLHQRSIDFIELNPDHRVYINKEVTFYFNNNKTATKRELAKFESNTMNYYFQQKRISELSVEDYIEENRKIVQGQYLNSTTSLGFRLAERGIDGVKDINVSRVSYEKMDCLLTLNDNTTLNCYSIIASGPIIQPHLRYLVK